MFYTKYRPQKFSEMSRPNEIAEALSKQVKTEKTVHAYLFVGPRGTGKTTMARILAKSLNCSKLKANGDPCDKCSNCESIKEGSFVDLIEIDAASNRGIDDIRDLKDKIKLAPTMGKNKVYIIDEVHMLTTEAFNALLKTLEEPPKKTTFILCTTEDHKVPATIKSRCQIFKFKRPAVKNIVSVLKDVAESEKIKISEDDLSKIAEASMGDYRGANVLLEQVSEGDIDVNTLLNLSSKKKYVECVDYLLSSKADKALDIVSDVYNEGIDLFVWVGELLKYLRSMIFVKSGASDTMTDVTVELLDEIKQQSKKVSIGWLIKSINILLEAHKNIRNSFIPQLPIEIAIVEICLKNEKEEEESKNGEDGGGNLPNDSLNDNLPLDRDLKKLVYSDGKLEKTKEKEDKGGREEKNVEKKDKLLEDQKVENEPKDPALSLKKLQGKWDKFVKDSKDLNHSLTALLTLCKPVGVEGRYMVLEVFYPFHKERLESTRTRKLIEGLSESVYGVDLSVKCVLSNEKPKKLKKSDLEALTDLNVTVPTGVDKKSIIEAFDGGLPIVARS